jgi:hypothetical protein
VVQNITVQEGDVTVQNPDSGIVMTDNVGDDSRLKIVDDNGVKTLIIEETV